ncbi:MULTISPECIES: hypothetical protein [Burkholderia]|nr:MULTISPECIES: hypothetical protein [Burkholderia]
MTMRLRNSVAALLVHLEARAARKDVVPDETDVENSGGGIHSRIG